MIRPAEDRLSYSKLLAPEGDYEIEFAIGTTYSLDLNALVGVSMAFGLKEEIEDEFIRNPPLALEGLRRGANKFVLFCEGGQTKVPHNMNSIYSLLEGSIYNVTLPELYAFHPKIWVLKYVNKISKGAVYRLIVLSRNLTFDRSWDLAVALDGELSQAKKRKNIPLIKFLNTLLEFIPDEQAEKKEQMQQLIEEVSYVAFDPRRGEFTDFAFCPLGIGVKNEFEKEIFEPYDELLIVSPFLGKRKLDRFNDCGKSGAKKTLITRRKEIEKLTPNLIRDFKTYVLSETVIDGEEMLSEDGNEDTVQKQDIHAKMYVVKKDGKHTFYIGSANCSNNAFNGNMEFMLKLEYQKRGFSIDKLLGDLFGDKEEKNPFEIVTQVPNQVEGEENIEEKLQRAIKKLCSEVNGAYVVKKGTEYILHILFNTVPEGVELTISPLQSTKEQLVCEETIIKGLSLRELGALYKVKARQGEAEIQRIIKIETSNIPKERDNEIFKDVIQDKEKFFRYISILLSDDFLATIVEEILQRQELGKGKWQSYESEIPVLYEKMLNVMVHNPQSLSDIGEIMKMLQGNDIVPDDFTKLYETFKAAEKKVKRCK